MCSCRRPDRPDRSSGARSAAAPAATPCSPRRRSGGSTSATPSRSASPARRRSRAATDGRRRAGSPGPSPRSARGWTRRPCSGRPWRRCAATITCRRPAPRCMPGATPTGCARPRGSWRSGPAGGRRAAGRPDAAAARRARRRPARLRGRQARACGDGRRGVVVGVHVRHDLLDALRRSQADEPARRLRRVALALPRGADHPGHRRGAPPAPSPGRCRPPAGRRSDAPSS